MEQYGGAILEIDEKDYKLGGEDSSLISINDLPSIKPGTYEYNQLEFSDKYGRNLCTCYAGIGMLANNSNKDVFDELRLELVKDRVTQSDFDPKIGGYLNVGVKRVIDYTNNGIMYRVHKSEVKKLNDKGYSVNIGMYVGNDLKLAYADGKITADEISKIKDKKYGHSTLLTPKWQDSYKGIKKPNIVEVDKSFVNSWFIFDYAYLIVPNYVIRDYFNKKLEGMTYELATEYYLDINTKLYPREKEIFQYCIQMKYVKKLNTESLKKLKF